LTVEFEILENVMQFNFRTPAFAPDTAFDRHRAAEPPTWDLSDLYQGVDDPQIAIDLAALRQQAEAFRDRVRGQVATLSPAEVGDCLQQLEAIAQQSGYLYAYPSLVFAANTQDAAAKQCVDRVMAALTDLHNQLLFFDLELQALPESIWTKLRSHSPIQDAYQHYLINILKYRPHSLSEAVEQTRNQAALTGREAFIQLRSIHLGEQKYPAITTPEGNIANTDAELSALSHHPDRHTRLSAYQSIRQVMQQHNSLYGYILNTVIQDHTIENQVRNYGSTLEKQLLADDVSKPVFQAIMQGTRDRFDLFQRYYQLKGQALGAKITTADLYAPWASGEAMLPAIDYATGVETLIDALKAFDINYAQRAEAFFLNRWVDAKANTGKQGGAFCWYVHGKHSYLLQSYTNDYSSLFTLAHEIGHGLHSAWIGDHQSYFNSNPPMVSAEIASTFNELLLLDYLLEQSKGNQALTKALITMQLEDQFNLLFRQSTISRLELALHDRAIQGSFDANFVNEQWRSLYSELGGDAVDVLPEHQYDWARIGHIYFKPFYCYQYTASNIVSLACYQKYRAVGKAFIPGYLALLSVGGSMDQVAALRQYVGVDLEDPATIRNSLNYVGELLDQLAATL
jgi:oligoendopeptidase F